MIGIQKNIPKNKVNQKEQSQLKKYFSSFIKIEKKLWIKSTWKPKKQRVSRQKSFNSFPCMTFIQIMYVYNRALYKAMSDTTDKFPLTNLSENILF